MVQGLSFFFIKQLWIAAYEKPAGECTKDEVNDGHLSAAHT